MERDPENHESAKGVIPVIILVRLILPSTAGQAPALASRKRNFKFKRGVQRLPWDSLAVVKSSPHMLRGLADYSTSHLVSRFRETLLRLSRRKRAAA